MSEIDKLWDKNTKQFYGDVTLQMITQLADKYAFRSVDVTKRNDEIDQENDNIMYTTDVRNDDVTTQVSSVEIDCESKKRGTKSERRLGNHSEKNDLIIKNVLADYLQYRRCQRNGVRIEDFLHSHPNVSKATLYRWLSASGISDYLKDKGDIDKSTFAEIIDRWLANNNNTHQQHTHIMGSENRMFTDNQEACMVNFLKHLGDAGHGCTTADLSKMAAKCMAGNEPFVMVPSRGLIRNMMSRQHSACPLHLRASKNLDEARARQANEDVRDVHFMKVDELVRRLHEAGISPWSSPSDIPPECIYNMDEVGLDTDKGKDKIYISAKKNSLFQTNSFVRTKEGDKMNRHVTLCLTTCANGTPLIPFGLYVFDFNNNTHIQLIFNRLLYKPEEWNG